jgi:hypothetical protein
MKSNNTLMGMSVLCLALAVIASTLVWEEVLSAAKIGMFAFGFATGIAAGALIVKRRNRLND